MSNLSLYGPGRSVLCLILVAFLLAPSPTLRAQGAESSLPPVILTGPFPTGHIQGIAVDQEKGFIYCSYTTVLYKCDFRGRVIGSVRGLLGHLGCLDLNPLDGRVYGSLEYKDDAIGKGILSAEGRGLEVENGFYVAVFDVDRIDRLDMDAEKDGVMTAVYLPTVLEDYSAKVPVGAAEYVHRWGCSGIDGLSFGPSLDGKDRGTLLTLAYGIYSEPGRTDNDYQVLLQYDVSTWSRYERPLAQNGMHRSGPSKPLGRYFARTGNTEYGVQNLEYDLHSGLWFMAVYPGKKPGWPNYSLFAVDGSVPSSLGNLEGVDYLSRGNVVKLSPLGLRDEATGVTGWNFPYGSTGMASLGGGLFYFSENYTSGGQQGALLRLYRFTRDGKGFEASR